MILTIEGELAQKLFELTKQDEALARALAKQYVGRIDAAVLHAYLVDAEGAQAMLAARLRADPDSTLADLQALAEGKTPAPRPATKAPRKATKKAPRKAAKKAPRKAAKKAPRKAAKKAPAKKAGRRRRFTAEQVEGIKTVIVTFLGTVDWATRKELEAKVDIPTQALYRRVINELKAEKRLVSKGEKSKTVYGLSQ